MKIFLAILIAILLVISVGCYQPLAPEAILQGTVIQIDQIKRWFNADFLIITLNTGATFTVFATDGRKIKVGHTYKIAIRDGRAGAYKIKWLIELNGAQELRDD